MCIATTVFSTSIPAVEGFGPSVHRGARKIDQLKRRNCDVVSSLAYRSHDNAEEQQSHHELAVSSRRTEQLVDQPTHHHVSNIFNTWWNASKSQRAIAQAEAHAAKEEKKQLLLDNYLESIDRRYKRLHKQDHRQEESPADGFTNAWQWLTHSEPNSVAEEQRKQEDAIHVLGLAGLASTKLLQRHQLPIPSSRVIDIVGLTEIIENPEVKATTVAVASPRVPDVARTFMTSAVFCVHLIKHIQTAYISRLATVSQKTQTCIFDILKFGGKAFTAVLAAVANLVTMNGAGKYAIHFISIFAYTSMIGAISALRPLLKA